MPLGSPHGATGAYPGDPRQAALWTGRAAPDDEPWWDEAQQAWTDGHGNYTDGYRTWSDPHRTAAGSGYDDPAGPVTWESPAGDEPDDLPVVARPVRLPLVITAVMAVLIGVGVLGAWVTDATGSAQPLAPVKMPAAPALPPRS
jgi:hypothetical protein